LLHLPRIPRKIGTSSSGDDIRKSIKTSCAKSCVEQQQKKFGKFD